MFWSSALLQTGKLALDHPEERALGLHLLRFAEVTDAHSLDTSFKLDFFFSFPSNKMNTTYVWNYCRRLRQLAPTCCRTRCANTSTSYLNATPHSIPFIRCGFRTFHVSIWYYCDIFFISLQTWTFYRSLVQQRRQAVSYFVKQRP